MGDDFFFAPPPPGGVPGFDATAGAPAPPGPGVGPAAAVPPPGPPPGPTPGMPGYSWQMHQQVRAEVGAGAPTAVPMSSATVVAAVAGAGALLMLVGAWAPWVSIGFASFHQKVGGLHNGLDGRYLLGMGFAALLTAVAALVQQSNKQVRMICAGALVAIGVIGLGVVIHEWTTITGHVREMNQFFKEFSSSFGGDPSSSGFPGSTGITGTNPLSSDLFSFHVAKGWGLVASGVACSITGLAGAYLFLVK